jgi:hypothetical protein
MFSADFFVGVLILLSNKLDLKIINKYFNIKFIFKPYSLYFRDWTVKIQLKIFFSDLRPFYSLHFM